MNRNYLIGTGCACAVVACALMAEGSFFDGGWRVSVGASYNAPAEVNLRFSPVKFSGGNVVPTVSGLTRAEAQAIAAGKKTGTRTTYSADGKTYYDSDYADKASGVGSGSWNVQAKYDTWNENSYSFTMASAEYVEVENLHDGCGTLKLNGSDEAAQPGVTVELSRNFYHNEEWNFGLDLAFAFSYFFDTDLYDSGRSYRRSDTYRVNRGKVETSMRAKGELEPELYLNDDGYYGSDYYGPGTLFHAPTMKSTLFSSCDHYSVSSFCANGDYRDLEMILALRPYYDILDWLRVYGTIGLAVSWTQFNLNASSTINGYARNYSRSYDQWDVYGVGGLGLMLRWRDFTLGFDFLARFLQDELDVNDDIVRGSLERGHWTFRGMIGYEF